MTITEQVDSGLGASKTNRLYNAPAGWAVSALEEALNMVKDLEGKAFDPAVVKAAVELHERGELALPSTPNPDITKVGVT
jgi:hypothetical protein